MIRESENIYLEKLFAADNIQLAIEHLAAKKNSRGDDGIWLHDLESYWKANGERISNLVKTGKYQPQLIHEISIIQADGKHRMIAKLSSVDRLLLRALYQLLYPMIEPKFSKHCFAYRNSIGVDDAVEQAVNFIERGMEYIVKVDIQDFFNSIEHQKLFSRLNEFILDEKIMLLIESYIRCTIECDGRIYQKQCGLVQGNSLSPLLSNLFLSEFDFELAGISDHYIRFADDISIYVDDVNVGCEIYQDILKMLEKYDLKINEAKSGVFSVYNKSFLGHDFEKKNGQVLVKKHCKKFVNKYTQWQIEPIKKLHDELYYIVDDGILRKKDFTILFENQKDKENFPCEMVDSINVFSDVEFSSKFFDLLSNYSVNMNLYNCHGQYIGAFLPVKQQGGKMNLLIKQVEVYSRPKKRLIYAKKMELSSLYNMKSNLKYYSKHSRKENLKYKMQEFDRDMKSVRNAQDIETLLLIEARSRQNYYSCFNDILNNESFSFSKRNRRPPLDPINALISFGNSVLYQRVAQIIHRTSVDIRISFVHSAMKRFENLNLDIADIFKPVIVDKVIFTLINKHMISDLEHFQYNEDGSVFLNPEGRKLYLTEFEKKMRSRITIDGVSFSYEDLIYQDIKKLEKSLLTGSSYKPFKYQL